MGYEVEESLSEEVEALEHEREDLWRLLRGVLIQVHEQYSYPEPIEKFIGWVEEETEGVAPGELRTWWDRHKPDDWHEREEDARRFIKRQLAEIA